MGAAPNTGQMCQVWEYEGRIYPYIGLNAVAGKQPEQYGVEPVRYDDMIPGCYDPKARVADMDIDGVQAMTCFPSFPRFAGAVFAEGEDKELGRLCSAAWNDFHLDEWAAIAPDRFVPVAMLPFWDLEASVKEIHRVAVKGAKCVTFPDLPDRLGLPSVHSDHWDPLLSAMEETGMVLGSALRLGWVPAADCSRRTIRRVHHADGDDVDDLDDGLAVFRHAVPAPEVEDRPVRGRHRLDPLHPGALRQRSWRKHRFYNNINQDHPPSYLFKKHIHGCFIEDDFGVAMRHWIGVDKITWECDYPTQTRPGHRSRERAAQALESVPDHEVHRMVELNAREFYNFPRRHD